MSKRTYRRLAVVAGAALAVGSMAPALALRIDGGAGAEVEVDPAEVIADVTGITGSLPLPELGELPIPSYAQLNGTLLGVGGLGLAGTTGLVDNILDHVTLVTAGLGGDCGLVAVASCNAAPAVEIPVQVAGVDVLGAGLLNGGDLGVGVIAPIAANVVAPIVAPVVANVGGILTGDGLGLGGLLDVDANANVLANVLAIL